MSIKLDPAAMCSGEAMEEFRLAIQSVLENITDPATPATAKRSATMTIEIKPNKERNMAEVMVHVTTKLAPVEAKTTSILIDKDLKTGMTEASELGAGQNPAQHELPGVYPENVSPFQKKAQEA